MLLEKEYLGRWFRKILLVVVVGVWKYFNLSIWADGTANGLIR